MRELLLPFGAPRDPHPERVPLFPRLYDARLGSVGLGFGVVTRHEMNLQDKFDRCLIFFTGGTGR